MDEFVYRVMCEHGATDVDLFHKRNQAQLASKKANDRTGCVTWVERGTVRWEKIDG